MMFATSKYMKYWGTLIPITLSRVSQSGKKKTSGNFFQAEEKSGSFVVGQGYRYLERTKKKKAGILKISGYVSLW